MSASVPLARVVRSRLEESVHLGDVAVCDAAGRVVAAAGDPGRRVFARSCMKPLQAAVSVAAAEEELPDRELAIMCSSHNGEPVHLAAVRAVLARAGATVEALRCPPSYPLDPQSMATSMERRREASDCSGKHAGMLLACARSGWDARTYTARAHPLQRRIHRAVLRMTGLDAVDVGVDGCGVPVHGMALASMAVLYARLGRSDAEAERTMARCVQAMLAQPYLVGGRNRVDTAIMRVAPHIVAKGGAEALYCASLRDAGLGVAIKIADGGSRAGRAVLVRALRLVDGLSAAEAATLRHYAKPAVLGGGRRVGDVVADFDLRSR
jgi:L-asparaginase II